MLQPIQSVTPVTQQGDLPSMDLIKWSQLLLKQIEAQAKLIEDLTARVEALE